MPPIFKVNLKRNLGIRPDARQIFYLSDGVLTEVKFFDSLFNETQIINSPNVRFVKCEKTGGDEGVSDGLGLLRLAKQYIQNSKDFRKGYDKVMIVFDLDTYISNLSLIIQAINENNDIIFAYSNPSFELLLLLCKDSNFIKKSTSDLLSQILKNNYVGNDRFVYHLLRTQYHFDSKNRHANFLTVAKNINDIDLSDLNIFIDRACKRLTCNIPYILDMIQKDRVDEIVYFAPENER